MTRRTERLGEEIREGVASLLTAGLKDPRIGFVTVTRVEVSDDLHHARVYVGVLGDEKQRKASLEGLRAAAGFLRREVGRRIRARYTPELAFHYDQGLEATERVARLLADSARPAEEGGPGDASDEEP